MSVDMDPQEFFNEMDRRMSIPDDDIEEYIERMNVVKRRQWEERMNKERENIKNELPVPDEGPTGIPDSRETSPLNTSKRRRDKSEAHSPRKRGRQNRIPDDASNTEISVRSSPIKAKAKPTATTPQLNADKDNTKTKVSVQNTPTLALQTTPSPSARKRKRLLASAPLPSPSSMLLEGEVDDNHAEPPSEPQTDPPTSPIEDPSILTCSKHLTATPPPKRELSMFEMIAERVDIVNKEQMEKMAKHQNKKPRLKTMNIGNRSSSPGGDVAMDTSSIMNDSSPPQALAGKKKASSACTKTSRPVKPQKTVVEVVKGKEKNKSTTLVVVGTTGEGSAKKMTRQHLESLSLLPLEFAKVAQEQAELDRADENKKGRKHKQYLVGTKIFYWGCDMGNAGETTKKRMGIILRHGGDLVSSYDPGIVTHIVSDCHGRPRSLLNALKLKSLHEIPDHIPCLEWSWVINSKNTIVETPDGPKPKLASYVEHAAFRERIPPIDFPSSNSTFRLKGKGKKKVEAPIPDSEDEEDASVIEDFTNPDIRYTRATSERATTRSGKPMQAGSSRVPLKFEQQAPTAPSARDDPLAPFYAEARIEVEIARERGRYGEFDETDDEDVTDSESEDKRPRPVKGEKRGFACDNPKNKETGPCKNQDVVDQLKKLLEVHRNKPGDEERWRVYSYSKAIPSIQRYHKRITSFDEARTLRGIGQKTAQKIMEIISTGSLRRIGCEYTESVRVTQIFQGIYGVGQNTAIKWYYNGCRTLEDLRDGKGGVRLSAAQKVGIKYYDDINARMPREEAAAIFDLIKPIALSIDPDLFVEIMGSFRRGKADCGDIDIMITRSTDDGRTHKGVLPKLLKALHEADILTEDLATPEDPNDLEAIYRGLCHLPGKPGARQRRIDFLTVPWKCKGAALLYYTGDDIFNRSMRLKARRMGYSLNQRGLYKGVVRQGNVKTNTGTLVASETEEQIFKVLGVPWQTPSQRVRS